MEWMICVLVLAGLILFLLPGGLSFALTVGVLGMLAISGGWGPISILVAIGVFLALMDALGNRIERWEERRRGERRALQPSD